MINAHALIIERKEVKMKKDDYKNRELRDYMQKKRFELNEQYANCLKNNDFVQADKINYALRLMNEVNSICEKRKRF
jgi:hypothetical protein